MTSAAAVLKPIHLVRKKNLVALVEKKFEGNASECARAIGRSHTYMWQLVQGYRGIGEGSARHIEQALDLAPNSLDTTVTKRSSRLQALDGKGNVVNYPMVPFLRLDALDAKPKEFVPCPLPDVAADKMFCTVIEGEGVVEVEQGDRVFVDRADVEPQSRKLFVVRPKGRSPCVLLAARAAGAWTYATTGSTKRVVLQASQVTVIGRLLLIVRQLAK
jgi:hypothetical protein